MAGQHYEKQHILELFPLALISHEVRISACEKPACGSGDLLRSYGDGLIAKIKTENVKLPLLFTYFTNQLCSESIGFV